MRLIVIVLFAVISTNLSAATFVERIAIAKKMESQKEASDYFFGSFFPTLSSKMGGIMQMCLNLKGANKEKFTLVANVALSGELIDIEFEPKSNNTGICFARELAKLKAPPPPLCDCGLLPVVIDMAVKP